MLTLPRLSKFTPSLLALASAALAAPSATAQYYDSLWKCVSSCCPECPSCVDTCTEDFNARQAASGDDYMAFFPSDSIRMCCPGAPGRVRLKLRLYRGGRHITDPTGIVGIRGSFAHLDVVSTASSWEEIPWEPLPAFEFDPGAGEWVCAWEPSVFGAPPVVIEVKALRDDGSVTPGAVNVIFGPDHWCQADCDESGSLDFFDFLCFQDQFAAGDPAADCDGSRDLDFFDFLCFQNAFAAGCP